MILDPVVSGRTPDETKSIFFQIEENRITDHISIMIAGDKLLGFIDFEIFEAVYAEIREQSECIRALNVKIRHVVTLFEKNAGLPPGKLFIPPVRVLGDPRKGIRSYLRVTQQFNRALDGL
jgi:hypothetical protein